MMALLAVLEGVKRFWKPLLVLAVCVSVYAAGYNSARQKYHDATLRAQNTELARQLKATQTVLADARAASAARQAELNRTIKEAESYVSELKESDRFILFDDDVSGLRRIK